MGGRPVAREHVGDHHVERPGGQPLKHRPRVAKADADPPRSWLGAAHGQPLPDEPGHLRVGLDRQLP